MSGAQTSTFSNAQSNVLFDPLAVQKAQGVQNQLLQQQQTISAENMAQVGQAAAGLLSAYPDEASRAAAYPRVVGMLQSQGFAKNAPDQYPGEGTLRAIVNASIPAKDLYSSGALLTPAQQAALGQGNAGTTPTAGTPTTGAPGSTTGATAAPSLSIPPRGTGGPGASASAPTEWLPYFEEASQKTGIPVDLLVAQARQESGFNPNATGQAGEIGAFQIKPSTAQSPGFGMAGVDPASITGPNNVRNNIMFGAQYLKALMGGGDPSSPAVQAAALHGYNGGGDPNYVANVFRYRPTLAPSDPNAAVTSYTPSSAGTATATAPAGGGGMPAPYQTASTAPTAPPGSTAAPAAAPASPAPDTPWDLPGAPAPDLPPPATPTATPAPPGAAPAQQFTYPNGKVGAAPDAQGGVKYADGSYGTPPAGRPMPLASAPTAAPGPQGQPPSPALPPPAAAPAGTANLPDASTIPTGRNSPAWQQAQQLINEGQRRLIVAGSNAGFRAQAQAMIAEGQREQQLDHIVSAQQGGREGKLNTTTGEFTPYQALPSPRGMQGTAAAWDGSKWVPVTPENQANAVQGTWAVTGSGAQFFPNSPSAIQRQEEAKTSGAATGTQTAQALPALIAQARAAAKNEGDIDYASNQIAQAAKGGIPTGYFSGALGTAAAVAKSLGIDTSKLGVDPAAVGDIQSAQKTLAVLGGAILQQAIGKGNPITDAKIEAFEHTQPGIETDPQALQRIMAWARSQYTYEREMGTAAVQEAAKPENNGILPPSFVPRYYATKGFAPVYEPTLGEMQQPDGRQPARETPPPVGATPVMQSPTDAEKLPPGTKYQTPDGRHFVR